MLPPDRISIGRQFYHKEKKIDGTKDSISDFVLLPEKI